MSSTETILAKLKEGGFRITSARKAIVEMFGTGCNPLSAQDVHERLKKKGFATNVTTVYRELQFLADQSVLHTVQFEDGVQRYEQIHEGHHHHHLVCVECKDVQEVSVEKDLQETERAIAKKNDFSILRHSLEFYGLCRKCR